MKAAVFTGPYEFKICDREKPKPGPKVYLSVFVQLESVAQIFIHTWGME